LYSYLNPSLAFLWAFMISVFAVPSIVRVSHQKKLLDEPNGRTIHLSSTPRLGGLAIFAGFVSSLTIFGSFSNADGVQQLLAGCSVLFFIGLKDDVVTVSAFKKFFVQILASGIVLFIGNIRITDFQGLLGFHHLPEGISYAFSLLVIIGITNAINLIDGLDGLAGSIICTISITFGSFFLLYGGAEFGMYGYVAICLVGGMCGFLRYNMHRANIFMGDGGSLVCGFIVSVLAIKFVEMKSVPASPIIALGALFVPLYDTLRVFTIRILRGKSPFSPDKNHIHHRFLAMGFSQLATVGILVSLTVGIVVFMINFAWLGVNVLLVMLVAVAAVLSVVLAAVPRLKKVSA
jgi:UDP-GlcNAc:undecaprenyl-phosphate/decaprenyl-phosphate GlcNAc-1-phosphate transferase